MASLLADSSQVSETSQIQPPPAEKVLPEDKNCVRTEFNNPSYKYGNPIRVVGISGKRQTISPTNN